MATYVRPHRRNGNFVQGHWRSTHGRSTVVRAHTRNGVPVRSHRRRRPGMGEATSPSGATSSSRVAGGVGGVFAVFVLVLLGAAAHEAQGNAAPSTDSAPAVTREH